MENEELKQLAEEVKQEIKDKKAHIAQRFKYQVKPLKTQLKLIYQEFYKKGYTSFAILEKSIVDYKRLLELYNNINKEYNKNYILDAHQYSLHLRQYVYMENYKSPNEKIRKPHKLKKKTKRQQIIDKIEIANQEHVIGNNQQAIQRQQVTFNRVKKDEISFIAQQNFLNELENTNFYNETINNIKNLQNIIYNKIHNIIANGEDTDLIHQKYIVALLEQYSNLIKSYGLDKLLQLQPQVINFLQQNNNTLNNNNNTSSNDGSFDINKILKDLKDI